MLHMWFVLVMILNLVYEEANDVQVSLRLGDGSFLMKHCG
ncbi:hypothetical protein GLYMA_14G152566v4 [Glycine max]|nr:hypothetical protein GLYMA_14G152566v4 [Glycine max]KAH1094607.1 hypothetical protein GYH30_040061 [Glycine max]